MEGRRCGADNDMCTAAQLENITSRVANCYREAYGDAVREIILFGSYARGDNDNDSDVDITAIVEGDRRELQDKLEQIWDISAEIGLENDVVVSPTVIPAAEYDRYNNILPYYRNIRNEGRHIG